MMNIKRWYAWPVAAIIALLITTNSVAAEYVDLVNEDFVHSVVQANRPSNAQVRNAQGEWESVAINTPRIQRNRNGEVLGLIAEYGSTNYLLNSGSPAAQSVSLSAGTYTLWMEGSGSVSVAQGTAAGSGFGTADDNDPVTFVITGSGAVDVSVSGSVDRFQLENRPYPTTYIPTTSSAGSRAPDLLSDEEILWYCQCGITVEVHGWGAPASENNPQVIHINNETGSSADLLRLRRSSSGILMVQTSVDGNTTAWLEMGTVAEGEFFSIAFRMDSNGIAASRDGEPVETYAFDNAGDIPQLLRMDLASYWGGSLWSAPLRRVRIYKTAKSDTELRQLSTYTGTIPDLDIPGEEPQPDPIVLEEGKNWDLPDSQLSQPAAGGSYEDPAYGPTVQRITDSSSLGVNWARNDYSRHNPFNVDSSRFLVRTSGERWFLYRTDDGSLDHELPFVGNVEPKWHGTDPDVVITLGSRNGNVTLVEYDTGNNDASSVIADFTNVSSIVGHSGNSITDIWSDATHVSTKNEGSPSQVLTTDGRPRYWAFMVDTSTDAGGMFTYDLQTDTILATYDFDQRQVGPPNHVSMSPSGDYMVASWASPQCASNDPQDLGTRSDPCGLMSFSRDLGTAVGIHANSPHSDIGFDAAGNDVIVYPDYVEDGEIKMADLATGTPTSLASFWDGDGGTSMHVSMKSFDQPGWALISTYDGGGQPNAWYRKKIFAIELKSNPRILNIAHTYNQANYSGSSKWITEPTAAVNRDFTRILYASNWGSGTTDMEVYLIKLPPGTIPDAQQ